MDPASWQFLRLSRTTPRRIPLMLYLQLLFCHLPSAMGWFFLGCGLAFAIPVMRHYGIAVFAGAAWVVLTFPLFGLAFILSMVLLGLPFLRFLKQSLPAVGTLVAMEEMSSRRSDGPVEYRMTFRFTTDTGNTQEITFTSNRPKQAWLIFYHQSYGVPREKATLAGILSTARQFMPAGIKQNIDKSLYVMQTNEPPGEKDLQETVLYLPANPARVMLPLSFREQISVDERGNLQGTISQGVMASVFPLLTFVGYYLMHHLMTGR
jgi:hypothetical protein